MILMFQLPDMRLESKKMWREFVVKITGTVLGIITMICIAMYELSASWLVVLKVTLSILHPFTFVSKIEEVVTHSFHFMEFYDIYFGCFYTLLFFIELYTVKSVPFCIYKFMFSKCCLISFIYAISFIDTHFLMIYPFNFLKVEKLF